MKYAIAYIVAVFFTFAYIQEVRAPPKIAAGQWHKLDVHIASILGGLFWPAYWGGTLALATVRYVKAHPGLCK